MNLTIDCPACNGQFTHGADKCQNCGGTGKVTMTTPESGQWTETGFPTLTKRELFAAMAMQALVGSSLAEVSTREGIADEAVRYADALIAELSKEQPKP